MYDTHIRRYNAIKYSAETGLVAKIHSEAKISNLKQKALRG
jgi:hypothetical protein